MGDEVSATVIRRDDGHGNILLSRVSAADVLAWDKLQELKESKEVLDVVVKGVVNGGVVAYVEGVRGFIPASKLSSVCGGYKRVFEPSDSGSGI